MSGGVTAPGGSHTPTPSDTAQHITFEGCDYCLISPEDYDALHNAHAELVAALDTCATRLERCIVAGGSDKEYAALAVSDYRRMAALAKVQS